MASHFRSFAIALTCLAWTSVAGAQDNAGKTDGARPPSESQPQSGKQAPRLSPAEKQTIFTLIRRTGTAVNPPPRDINVAVGAQVPDATELFSLPQAAFDKVPSVKPYEFTIVNNAFVLVDPASRKIVAIGRQ
jgi:hypothetical protein